MEEQREESGFDSDCREHMEEGCKGLGLAAETGTLGSEDANVVEVLDSGFCDVSEIAGGLATVDADTDDLVSDEAKDSVEDESTDNIEETVSSDDDSIEPETERHDVDAGTDEVQGSELCKDVQRVDETVEKDETTMSAIKSENGESLEDEGEDESVISGGNEVADEKENCEVEDNGGDCDAKQNVGNSQQSSVDGEMLSVAEEKADQVKESAMKSEEDNSKMDVDSKELYEENVGLDEQGTPGSETEHSESAQVPEDSIQLSKEEMNEENQGTVIEVSSAAEICPEEEITNGDQIEENGDGMEVDCAAEEHLGKDVTVGGILENAGNESAGASMTQKPDVPRAEADKNDSNVFKDMEIDERKDDAGMSADLTGTIESADSANPNSPREEAATGEVEPLDHNALFDPSSDITNFIDFSGVSSWSGNIQDLKTETGNVSLKEDIKPTDMAEEVSTVAESYEKLSSSAEGIDDEPNEAHVAFGAESPAAATDCSKESPFPILGSDENQEDTNHECLDKETQDQLDAMREEDNITQEAPSIDPDQKEDTEMKENSNNSDYTDDGTDSGIKPNGGKRKADVLSENSPGEGRKSISFAKVSFTQRPSFKIGACIARAASQMAESPSVLKGNVGDETLSVESFVSQLHCAARDPDKENVVSEIAAGFFLDFRNSSASQQAGPEKVSSKRGRPLNCNAGGTEAFEFEELGDTYWTDRVIHNGGEEQTPPTEKENYKVVPVELKPVQLKRTRRPYRRRQSQISSPLPASDKPANYDENAPAELIMNFSETDTIPPEKSLSKMFRHFGPIRESQTEVDEEKNRARIVYRKGTDAEVAYNSAGRFSIFGTKAVNYELSYTVTEAFKVHPYVVSLGEE